MPLLILPELFPHVIKKLAGMTRHRQHRASEFREIYNLGVVEIPTNLPIARKDEDDQVYVPHRRRKAARRVGGKFATAHDKGQPILVGHHLYREIGRVVWPC